MITDQYKQVKLGFLTGLVPKGKSMAFERILFRATRGNVFLKQAAVEVPVTDPVSGEKVNTSITLVWSSLFENMWGKVLPMHFLSWLKIQIHDLL